MMCRLYSAVLVLAFCLIYFSAKAQCVGTEGQVTWKIWEDLPYFGMEQLWAQESYPLGPDKVRTLQSLSTNPNYDNNFGGFVEGFISVPETGSVTFNVVGDDQTLFLLSTDATAAHLDTIAYIEEWTRQEEHNKYPTQTSTPRTLVAGQLYYFILQNQDGGGGDHASIYWQRPYLTDSTWTLITSPYLTDVCDPICEPLGTACNDGNPSTTDDMWDGNCNCVGRPNDTGIPVGERNALDVYFYNDIPYGNLEELFLDPDFPAMPDRMTINRTGLFAQWDSDYSDYGSYAQGYITAPETACYDFNITGTNDVMFRIYADETPQTVLDSAFTYWGTGRLEHDHPSMDGVQTIHDVCLEANTYYYFEMLQVNRGWGHRYSLHWRPDFYPDDAWHRVPSIYFYDYTDELACLPAGAACDDGDPLTANDVIINNGTDCGCVGTPCDPNQGNCDDPAAYFMKYDYCDVNEEIGTREDDAWLSCTPSANPYVAARSGQHWIHYDLGDEYILNETHIWNYNVDGQTQQGFSGFVVDYSVDGVEWYELGYYDLSLASGQDTYTGEAGPDFQGEVARYVMITSTDDPSSCRGLSKVTFNASLCPDEGTMCDDGDADTYNDHIGDDCLCRGYTLAELNCQVDTLFVNETDVDANSYHAMKALMSQGNVMSSADVHYRAGVEILLESGFEVEVGGSFEAQLEDCPEPSLALLDEPIYKKSLKKKERPKVSLSVYALEGREEQTIRFYIPESASVALSIRDQKGNLVYPVVKHHYDSHGSYYKRIQTKKIPAGVYMVHLDGDLGQIVEKMVIL